MLMSIGIVLIKLTAMHQVQSFILSHRKCLNHPTILKRQSKIVVRDNPLYNKENI